MAKGTSFISTEKLKKAFGNDSAWFKANVPMFECSDTLLEDIYLYRWKSYKAHIRDLGRLGYVITEFLDDVGWQKHPYAMLNDATGFHIYEGRWLRDRQYMDGFLEFLYPGGGNDRHFAESIADAAHAYYLVHGDAKFAVKHLPAMKHIFNLWDDHFDFDKGLYFIEPLLDATEYTVSSIDASGGKDGFRGGDAFRPTINAYMYANALAISHFSTLAGDKEGAAEFLARAKKIKSTIQTSLWNEDHEHFMDRYKVSNQSVKYWDFIRARELAGYVPWTHNLPDDQPKYAAAWKHVTDRNEFAGPHGLRTIGPKFEFYMKQYRYLGTAPECQWNGPSWPFQTTQVLLGMANVLNGYKSHAVSPSDYIGLLRQYAQQHYLNGKPNLQEDYNPDTGKPIVGLDRSHHYNHSGFVDLIITGLCGLRPRSDQTLEINPIGLKESEIGSFCLENVPYHGNLVTIVWDVDGKKYGQGAGLSVFVNGMAKFKAAPLGKSVSQISLGKTKAMAKQIDLALNIYRTGYPIPSASSDPEKTLWQAVDGREWFFPEMVRGWSPDSKAGESWYEVAFEVATDVHSVSVSFYGNAPESYEIQAMDTHWWTTIYRTKGSTLTGTEISHSVKTISTNRLRIVMKHTGAVRLVSFKVF